MSYEITLADLINAIIGIGALIFTGISWRRQNKRDKLEEQRYQESKRKSLKFNITFSRYHIGWTPEEARFTFILKAEVINDGPNPIVLNDAKLNFYNTAFDRNPFHSHYAKIDDKWKNTKLNPQDNWFIDFLPIVDENEEKVQNSLVEVVITDIVGNTYKSKLCRYARSE